MLGYCVLPNGVLASVSRTKGSSEAELSQSFMRLSKDGVVLTDWTKFSFVVLVAAAMLLAGCANRLACQSICGKYQECFNSEYDTQSCVNSCVEESREDEDYSRRVETCQVCIEDRACSESAFGCATDCVGIVP
jgi:hypothetical protein